MGLRSLDSLENLRSKISKNEVYGKNTELGFFEIRFTGIDQNKFFGMLSPKSSFWQSSRHRYSVAKAG